MSGYNEFTIPSVTDTIVPTTEVSFKCKPGYQLPVGDTGTRTCQKGGTMSASPPACEGNYIGKVKWFNEYDPVKTFSNSFTLICYH